MNDRPIIDLAPYKSINATHEHSHLSEKYSFVPTTRIIDLLDKEGWRPMSITENRVRTVDKLGYQKHMLRFRHEAHLDGSNLKGGLIPEVVLTNSHDGSTAFQIMAGIFRIVCGNGLIVADSMFAAFSIKHIGFRDEDIINATYSVAKETPRIMDRVHQFQSLTLKKDEQWAFAEMASQVRFPQLASVAENSGDIMLVNEDGNVKGGNRKILVEELLKPRREEDAKPTLWNTYNIIQEKFVRGEPKKDEDAFNNTWLFNPTRSRHQRTRGIKNIHENIRINRILWALTEKMAELKSGVAAA